MGASARHVSEERKDGSIKRERMKSREEVQCNYRFQVRTVYVTGGVEIISGDPQDDFTSLQMIIGERLRLLQ
jgi:hypothetical protein